MKKTSSSRNTIRIVICGILSALSIIFMLIGAITDVLDLSMLMLTSLCLVFVVIEIGCRWAWLVWGVTAMLCLLLLPSKTAALLYGMGGMYPILKSIFEKLPKFLAWLCKFLAFNAFQCLYIFLAQKLFGLSGEGYEFVAAALAMNNVLFLLYDIALTAFISFYFIRLRKQLKIKSLR